MTTVYEIPLSATPQSFNVTLGTTSYEVRLVWNYASSCWVLDFSDSAGTPVLVGVPLVVGADLLAQHKHLGFSGTLRVQNDSDVEKAPTYEDLGQESRLYFVVEE